MRNVLSLVLGAGKNQSADPGKPVVQAVFGIIAWALVGALATGAVYLGCICCERVSCSTLLGFAPGQPDPNHRWTTSSYGYPFPWLRCIDQTLYGVDPMVPLTLVLLAISIPFLLVGLMQRAIGVSPRGTGIVVWLLFGTGMGGFVAYGLAWTDCTRNAAVAPGPQVIWSADGDKVPLGVSGYGWRLKRRAVEVSWVNSAIGIAGMLIGGIGTWYLMKPRRGDPERPTVSAGLTPLPTFSEERNSSRHVQAAPPIRCGDSA
jgi:hypothetical protein